MSGVQRDVRQKVLDEVQGAFPLESDPYGVLATRLGLGKNDVLDAMAQLRAEGTVRRLGASFSSAKLGFTSSLCALAVSGDEGDVDRVADVVSAFPEVTHNYLRDNRYNLWFTVIAPGEDVRHDIIDRIASQTGCHDVLDLPATALYKIRVDFGRQSVKPEPYEAGKPFDAHNPFDVALVRWAQGDEPGQEPFSDAAQAIAAELADASVDESRVLARLRSWKADATMRRFGAMVRHRKMGYLFNGMSVFDVTPDRIDEVGEALASFAFVSHCYARPRSEKWPYNLYAMVHAKTRDELEARVAELEKVAGAKASVLVSTKEYKKTSPTYFAQP